MDYVVEELKKLSDEKYALFQIKLTPGLTRDRILGVRNPVMRQYAKGFFKNELCKEFLKELPHMYYDENMLHSLLIEQIKDYYVTIDLLDKFLPFIDNWAVCDTMRPKSFKKNLDKLILKINEWVNDDHEYTVRFAIEQLMSYYLDDNYKCEYLLIPLEVNKNKSNDKYYINMMIAWYYATALSKHYDDTIKIIESYSLSKWVHNKTIQKAIESYRITDEQKEYLKSLKIK